MESKNKEWIAIVVCIVTGVVANLQSFGQGTTQEKIEHTSLNHREAILDVREKIDFLYRRVARLENNRPILPPGPAALNPPIDAGVNELEEIDATPEEVEELFGPDPEEKKPEEKPRVEKVKPDFPMVEQTPQWKNIDYMVKPEK